MFQSKPIKDFADEKEPSKLYLWWIESTIGNWYYAFTWKYIQEPIFQVKRLAQWYWNVFRFDYDFDGHCLYAIIEYKLIRLQACLLEGNAIQDPKDLKALKLAIKLAGRLKDDNYDIVAYDRHEKKWGIPKRWSSPVEGKKNLIQSHYTYPSIHNVADEKKCAEDRRTTYLAADIKCKREERWLYAILHKYLRNLWD